MGRWVELPSQVTPDVWGAVGDRLRYPLREFARTAGLRVKMNSGKVLVAADLAPRQLVYATPLQTATGDLRSDVAQVMAANALPDADLGSSLSNPVLARTISDTDLNRWQCMQRDFLVERNIERGLRDLIAGVPEMRLFRIGGTEAFRNRLFLWRVIRHVAAGVHPHAMPLGSKSQDRGLLSGFLELTPAAIVCSPLATRQQPFALVLTASNGAEVAAVPAVGAGWVRPGFPADWPVGVGRPSLYGSGHAAYRMHFKTFPPGHGQTLLEHAVDGANTLFAHATDPATFEDGNGRLNVDEQLITWSDLRFGFDAINSVAADWYSSESIWAAFRALTILQGIWEGGRRDAVPLSGLLHPINLRDRALPAISESVHHRWASGIVDNYESELTKGFPGLKVDDAAAQVQELRNLVHGVGKHTKQRDARLATLRMLDLNAPNIQLVRDVACLWWTAVLLDARRLLRPGRAPWEA